MNYNQRELRLNYIRELEGKDTLQGMKAEGEKIDNYLKEQKESVLNQMSYEQGKKNKSFIQMKIISQMSISCGLTMKFLKQSNYDLDYTSQFLNLISMLNSVNELTNCPFRYQQYPLLLFLIAKYQYSGAQVRINDDYDGDKLFIKQKHTQLQPDQMQEILKKFKKQ